MTSSESISFSVVTELPKDNFKLNWKINNFLYLGMTAHDTNQSNVTSLAFKLVSLNNIHS